MPKIIFIYFLILFSGLNVFAQGCSPLDPRCLKNNSFNGAYIGTSVHQEFKHAKTNIKGESLTFNMMTQNRLSMSGNAAAAFVGTGKAWETLYIGAEIGAETSNASAKNSNSFLNGTNNVHKINIRKTKTFFAMGRIGTFIKEKHLIYIKGGIGACEYNFLFNINCDINNVNINQNHNKRIIFPLVTFGAEFLVPEIFKNNEGRVGIEYDYYMKKNLYFNHMNNTFRGITKVKMSSDILKIRLIYKI